MMNMFYVLHVHAKVFHTLMLGIIIIILCKHNNLYYSVISKQCIYIYWVWELCREVVLNLEVCY